MKMNLPLLVVFTLALFPGSLYAANDKAQANSRDDAWEAAWVAHSRQVLAGGTGKTAGFVLQIGDSITFSNPGSQWPRYGAGKTSEDSALCTWIKAGVAGSGTGDTSSKNGYYLAIADTSGQRGMTASSGISAAEYLSGNGNNGNAMPSDTNTASAKTKISDGATYSGNIHIDTLLAAFADAQFAVLMIGTNDANGGRTPSAYNTDLIALVDKIEARNIVPILSTIPPTTAGGAANIDAYNTAIRTLAQTRGLPLIDYHAEILARRSGTTWQNTIISSDGIHPSATGGGADSSSDPYANGGDAATHRTGTNCDNVGYLLRSWLTIQKLKEVKSYVVDGNNPPPPPATVNSISVSPTGISVATNGSQTFTATAKDSGGVALSPQPVITWSVSGGGTISASGTLSAGTTAGGPFTVSASSGGKTGTATFSLVRVNAAPQLLSLPTATPNPAITGASISFAAFASDADNEPITFAWNFGDGSSATGSTPQHAYTTPGQYTVSVSVSDPQGASVSQSIIVGVVAPSRFDVDDDGDGFSNGAEDAAGTNASSATSFPGGPGDSDDDGIPDDMDSDDDNDGVSDSAELAQGTDPWNALSFKRLPLVIAKLSGRVQGAGKDSLTLSGVITGMTPGFAPLGSVAELQVGSAPVTFTLDTKAGGKNANGTLGISLKPVQKNKTTKQSTFLGGDVKFKAKLGKGTWATAWGVNLSGPSSPLVLPITLRLGGLLYGADVQVNAVVKNGKASLKK